MSTHQQAESGYDPRRTIPVRVMALKGVDEQYVSFSRRFVIHPRFGLSSARDPALDFQVVRMTTDGTTMMRVWGGWLACLLVLSTPLAAREETPLALARGARVGVVNLLHPEVAHFHSAKALKDQALKTELVDWPVDTMLLDALKERAGQMGLVLVPLPAGDELEHAREDCFLNNGFNKNLPKECVPPFAHLLANEHLQAVIMLAPGLNNSQHAGSERRKELPEYLRGWGYVTGVSAAPSGKPNVFSMTDLLLVAPSEEGAQLRGHDWGGNYSLEWTDFVAQPDPKVVPLEEYRKLRPLFAGILSRQAARVLDDVLVGP